MYGEKRAELTRLLIGLENMDSDDVGVPGLQVSARGNSRSFLDINAGSERVFSLLDQGKNAISFPIRKSITY